MPNIRHRCEKPGCTGRHCSTGKWYWQVRVTGAVPVYGSHRVKSDGWDEAVAIESRVKRELRDGTYAATERPEQSKTLADLIDAYLTKVLPDKDRNRSARDTIRELQWWRRAGGRRQLAQVTPEWVSTMKLRLRKTGAGNGPLAKASVNRYLAALSGAYTGVERELHWRVHNPVKAVAKYTETLGTDRVFSHDAAGSGRRHLDPATELPKLLESAAKHGQLERVVVLVATGMRKGALEALELRNLHLGDDRAWIEEVDPKNGESRGIDIADGTMLRPVTLLRELVASRVGDSPDALVFGVTKRKTWAKMLREAGIENFAPMHGLRHTAASYMAMAGIEGRTLMQMMGWKSSSMPNRYVHLSPDHTASVARRYMAKY